MKITRERRLTVNLGNYESYAFGAHVEMSHHDLGFSDDDVRQMDGDAYATMEGSLVESVTATLNSLLLEDITDAQSLTAEKKSVVLAGFKSLANTN